MSDKNKLFLSIENNTVVSRLNNKGKGSIVCGFVNDKQVDELIKEHNKCEELNPSIVNAKAVRA